MDVAFSVREMPVGVKEGEWKRGRGWGWGRGGGLCLFPFRGIVCSSYASRPRC